MVHELPSLSLDKLIRLSITAIIALALTFYDLISSLFVKKKRSLTGKVHAKTTAVLLI